MSIYRPDACLNRMVNAMRNGTSTLNGCKLGVYTTDRVWLAGDDTAQATAIEAAFGGYAQQTITDWGAAVASGNISTTLAGLYIFTATGSGLPVTCYGILVFDSTGGLLFVEKNPTGGITLTAAGQSVAYRPSWSDKNL